MSELSHTGIIEAGYDFFMSSWYNAWRLDRKSQVCA
nr:MAG TPA: hypothetical protein [Caudoviricetes sp.]